jgi:hypothetical protein
MVRILIPYVYNLSESLTPLTSVKSGDKLSAHLYGIFNAHSTLRAFLYQSVWSSCLRVCKGPGKELLEALQTIYEKDDMESELDYWEIVAMNQKLTSFKTVLEAEFQTAATYLVTPRRGYDIATLIENAEIIFPEELMRKVPDTLFDLREAGKCIAFELGTAAGFHLLRTLETVIRAYWGVVMEGAPLPKVRNLGVYIHEMEKAQKGNAKVLMSLRQIKDHHRNELMHPEEKLDLDQAIGLMGIIQSAIVTMLREIPEPTIPVEPLQPAFADVTGELLLSGGEVKPV